MVVREDTQPHEAGPTAGRAVALAALEAVAADSTVEAAEAAGPMAAGAMVADTLGESQRTLIPAQPFQHPSTPSGAPVHF